MIFEIFKAAVHSVGTATTMTAAGVYLHRRGMITTETKTGMARYTQQIAIPALFFTKIVDCPQNFSQDTCPNILDHLGDAWVLLIWPFYVLGVGILVGKLMIYLVQPPEWQNNCILAATAFANAMGMPITLLDVIGHNFQPPAGMHMNQTLDPSMFQSIYVILNPVLQWGLGGWLLSKENNRHDGEPPLTNKTSNKNHKKIHPHDHHYNTNQGGESTYLMPIRENSERGDNNNNDDDNDDYFVPLAGRKGKFLSFISLEDAGYSTDASIDTKEWNESASLGSDENNSEEEDHQNEDRDLHNYGSSWQQIEVGKQQQVVDSSPNTTATTIESYNENRDNDNDNNDDDNNNNMDGWQILKKIASKAMQPPALGAMAGFIVASYGPLRGLFVDLAHRADNAPLEWIFDGVLTLANSAIPVNMCVVGVNLSIASQRRSGNSSDNVSNRTVLAVVLGKMLVMPLIGIITVWILKTFFWNIPPEISFQFYLVLLMNFVTPTANVVMVIAELGSGPNAKNVMATLIGWQYVVAPILLSLSVMMIVWTAVQ